MNGKPLSLAGWASCVYKDVGKCRLESHIYLGFLVLFFAAPTGVLCLISAPSLMPTAALIYSHAEQLGVEELSVTVWSALQKWWDVHR